jgi:hypothetical protein
VRVLFSSVAKEEEASVHLFGSFGDAIGVELPQEKVLKAKDSPENRG